MQYFLGNSSTDRGSLYIGQSLPAVAEIIARTKLGDRLFLFFDLPVSFEARVIREPGKRQIVLLNGHGVKLELKRDRQGQPGDLAVTCDSEGAEVPVGTINLAFGPYKNRLTHLGHVWVTPGDPARAYMIFNIGIGTMTSVTKAILSAEQVMREKVIGRFPGLLLV